MANRKEVAEQNKQAEQANIQAEQTNTDAQNNKAPVENKNDAKVNEAASNKDDKAAAAKNTPAETKNNAPAIVTDKKNEYVIVCLKHPHGIKFKLGNNRHVTIQGNATHLKDKTTGVLPDGGFGMTTILKEDWEAIKNTYSTVSIFKSGLIFASADTASAQAQAKEHDELKSGFEPVDIKKEKNIGVKDFEK